MAPFDDLKAVKKFTSRKSAVARIRQAVQRLSPDGAPQAAPVAPAKAKSKKAPAKANWRARAQKGATEARANKKAEVIAMMKRAKGATLIEIMGATSWQAHTIRGFVGNPDLNDVTDPSRRWSETDSELSAPAPEETAAAIHIYVVPTTRPRG